MDLNEATTRVQSLVDSSTDPELSYDEVVTLVADAERYDAAGNSPQNINSAPTWQSSTAYAFGDVVTADPAAGRWWQCVQPGTSAATQPDWPDVDGTQPGTQVTDDDVVWVDAGAAWEPTYDLNAAAAAGWRLKAGRAATRFDFATDGQTFRRGQIVAHCRAMERDYRRKVGRLG